MDTLENVLRWTVGGILATVAVVGWLGGRLTRISGQWQDGDRLIRLSQWGPWIRGHAEQDGGHEEYSGFAFFGRIRLTRRARGERLLQAMGFSPEVVPLLGHQAMAHFVFRRVGRELRGTFEGRHFQFERSPARLTGVSRLPPEPRVWQRVS